MTSKINEATAPTDDITDSVTLKKLLRCYESLENYVMVAILTTVALNAFGFFIEPVFAKVSPPVFGIIVCVGFMVNTYRIKEIKKNKV